jgi:hypothetical protein
VQRRLFALLLLVFVCPSTAAATPVVVLGPGRHVRHLDDPFAGAGAGARAPAPVFGVRASVAGVRASVAAVGASVPAVRKPAKPRKPPERTLLSELLRIYRTGAITLHDYHRYKNDFNGTLATVKRLAGTRRAELQSVVTTLHGIAASGQLSASRLPALFLTLDRNRQWWTTGPLLSGGQRVEFSGSELVWEYYAGRGIQLQELGSFGKADGLYSSGAGGYPAMKQLLAEIIPLAAQRAGGIAWEYYFSFDGGSPPWTSAMSQATALEALTRAYKAFGDAYYLSVAQRALPLFGVAPPVGVAVRTDAGARFLQYTFAPGADILNAFLQTLIGLHDYAASSGDQTAQALFAAGDAQARGELGSFDTGGWSLYQPGVIDTLEYHQLVTGFLQTLCGALTPAYDPGAPAYCTTASRFQSYLTTPPALTLVTANTRVGVPTRISFSLSKPAHVGIVVTRGTSTVLYSSADFDGGTESFYLGRPRVAGPLAIRLAATDLAGNFTRITGTLNVH